MMPPDDCVFADNVLPDCDDASCTLQVVAVICVATLDETSPGVVTFADPGKFQAVLDLRLRFLKVEDRTICQMSASNARDKI